MKPCVLVTGGAGYIGSHCCYRLAAAGYQPVVYDNLSNGSEAFVRWGPLEQGDIRDTARLAEVFARHEPVAVMHFAALIDVAESVRDPIAYYDVNVGGAMALIAATRAAGVRHLVFSSTCATFGNPHYVPISETHRQEPINPYGHDKLLVERMLRELSERNELLSVMLRYFNAAGSAHEQGIGESHDPETHAIPLALAAATSGECFRIYGDDYPTRDGTAERDYIHVLDLAEAHVLALQHLLDGGPSEAFNLGTGRGTTVRELVDAIRSHLGLALAVAHHPRRPGDAPILVADNRRIRRVLGWRPRHELRDIIDTAFCWHMQTHAGATRLSA